MCKMEIKGQVRMHGLNLGLWEVKQERQKNPHGEPHSWFAGYVTLPNEEKLSLAIIIENGGKGSQVAAPMAKIIFDNYGEKFFN